MTSFVELPDSILNMLDEFIVPILTDDEKYNLKKKKVAAYNKNKYNNNPEYNSYKKEQAKKKYQQLRRFYIDNKDK